MKKQSLGFILMLILLIGVNRLSAQNIHETIPVSGGEATGSSGSISFTVGQVVYQTYQGTNYSEAQGVQQPYEISIVDIEDGNMPGSVSVFPNPTDGLLWLIYNNKNGEEFNYQVTDITGKIIFGSSPANREVTINMNELPAGTYFLNICNMSNETKSFKIIKN